MRIPALALAQRALLLDTRGHAPYVLRILLVGCMLLALWAAVETSRWRGAPGMHLFSWLLYTNFFFISLFGVSTFSAVITEEKENMTLGLLKLAGFSGGSILAGKSLGQLLTMVLLLLVQVPFALLAITLGGVHLHQIIAAWLILLAHLLFVYSLGLCASVVALRSVTAARLTGFALVSYYVLPWIAMWLDSPSPNSGLLFAAGSAVWQASALNALAATTMTGFALPWFDTPVIVTLSLATALSVLAGLLFEPCTRSEVAAAPSRGIFGEGPQGSGRPISRVRGHPVFWKDFQFVTGGRKGLLFRVAWYGTVFLACWLLMPQQRGTEDFGQGTMIVTSLVFVFDLGGAAARMFREEIKWRTLPLLLTLPIPLRSWAYAKVAASATLGIPALLFFMIGASMAPQVCDMLWRHVLSRGTGWYALGMLVAGLHLTVYLSLRVRRGAFPLAILLVFVVLTLVMMIMAFTMRRMSTAEICMGTLGMLLITGALCMHPAIGRLLTRKAAE